MIFVIQIGNEKARLIEAASKKKAIQFALPVVLQSDKAKPETVAALMEDGVKVEKAE